MMEREQGNYQPPNPLPPPEPPPPNHQQPAFAAPHTGAPPLPPWPGFSKNGVLSLSLGMAANNPAGHCPLFSCRESDPLRGGKHKQNQRGAKKGFCVWGSATTRSTASTGITAGQPGQSIWENTPAAHHRTVPTRVPPPGPSSNSLQPERQGNSRELPRWAVEAVQQEDRVSFNWYKAAEKHCKRRRHI